MRESFRLFLISLIGLWIFHAYISEIALAAEDRPIVFIHADLIPMTTETVLTDHTLIVEGKLITVVGPSKNVDIPNNAEVINCRNAFLMPGLSDMHMHLRYDWVRDAWPVSPLKLYLANGVTTIRCFGPQGETGRYALIWQREIDAGRLAGPNNLTCGPQLRGHFKKDPEQIVINQKYQGFDFIKIYSYVTREEYHTILSTAGKQSVYTAGHIPFQVGLDGVLADSMDEIAHIEDFLWELSDFDRGRYFEKEGEWMTYVIHSTFHQFEPYLDLKAEDRDRLLNDMVAPIVNKFKDSSIPVCTTMVLDDVIVQKFFEPDLFLKKPEIEYMPKGYRERFLSGNEKHQLQFKGGEAFARLKYEIDKIMLKGFKKAGIRLLLSTDAGTGKMGIVPGFSIHDELRILVENGFTPYEALAAGTVIASKTVKRMNGKDEFGTIAPGKRADLILLKQNPLEDVSNARKIIGVMAAGRWYDQKAIVKMLVK